MAEVKVPYEVNDRQFEGMIVYDDTVQRKCPVVFMQPDWKGVCADTVAQARHCRRRLRRPDGRHVRRQLREHAQDARATGAGMKAVQDDLAFTLTCGQKAYETLFAAPVPAAGKQSTKIFRAQPEENL
jgi:hypothetical protein